MAGIGIKSKKIQFNLKHYIQFLIIYFSWLDFIYSDREVDLLHDEKPINSSHPNAYLHSCLHDYSHLITNKYMSDEWDELISISYDHKFQDIKKSHQAKLNSVGQKRHWLLDYTFIKDEDILKHRGKDASNYLLFQRYIIYILTFLSIIYCLRQ